MATTGQHAGHVENSVIDHGGGPISLPGYLSREVRSLTPALDPLASSPNSGTRRQDARETLNPDHTEIRPNEDQGDKACKN